MDRDEVYDMLADTLGGLPERLKRPVRGKERKREMNDAVKTAGNPLQSENARLASNIGRLEELADKVYTAIGPILCGAPPQPESEDKEKEIGATCEIGRQMREHSDKINNVCGLLQDILSRCQL